MRSSTRRALALVFAATAVTHCTNPQGPSFDETAVIAALRQAAVPVGDSGLRAQAPRSVIEQLADGATIIGLGESTHGTREFFLYKNQAIELLAAKGVRVIGFEAPWASARTIGAYVNGANISEATVADALQYKVYRTREVLDLLAWMRTENQTRPPATRLVYAPFDPQDYLLTEPGGTIPQMDAVLRPVDAPLADSVWVRYDALAIGLDTVVRTGKFTPAQGERLGMLVRVARERLAAAEGTLATRLGAFDAAWLVRSAAVVEQFITQARLTATPATEAAGFTVRDSSMAANAQWWLAMSGSGARAALWAHNGHVGITTMDGSLTMGTFLRRALGDRYRVLGFSMGGGRFNGNVPSDPQLAPPAKGGTVDGLLARVATQPNGIWLADLRSLSEPAAGWATSATGQRWLGSGVGDTNLYLDLPLRPTFDALLFVNQTTASIKVP